jgi:tRNA threonylcarbamoyladenosine biosynthesis protein TsaB
VKKILALSTSTSRGSAALLDVAHVGYAGHAGDTAGSTPFAGVPDEGGRLLAAQAYVDLKGHAERIFEAIDGVFRASGLARTALGALACDVGPGSFTGVRVAVAAAKGIALALGIPVLGVTSLEAMAAAAFAEGAASRGDFVVSLIDARKGEVFLAAFDAPGAPPLLVPQHLPRDAAFGAISATAAGRRLVVVGEVAEEIPSLRAYRARSASLDLPDAAWIGRVGIERFRAPVPRPDAVHGAGADVNPAFGAEGALVSQARALDERDAAFLDPLYVRAPDAKPAELGYTPPR